MIIFTKFHKDRTKIVDFSLIAKFWACLLFFYSPSISDKSVTKAAHQDSQSNLSLERGRRSLNQLSLGHILAFPLGSRQALQATTSGKTR